MKRHKDRILVRAWLRVGLCATVGLQAGLAVAQPEYPIQKDAVFAAILAKHPELSGASLKMAMSVEAREPAPLLLVGPVQEFSHPDQQKSESRSTTLGRIEIRCARASDCLPFVTWVRLPEGFISQNARPDSAQSGSTSRVSAKGGARLHLAAAVLADNNGPAARPVLHHGERVRLLLDSGLLHVSLPAFCLQDAAVGASIRVRSAKGEREYLGVVVDATTVRGAL